VVLNRLNKGRYGDSVEDIVLKKNQFEPWNNPQTRKRLEKLSTNSQTYKEIERIVDQVLAGQIPDSTKGATHFVAPVAQRNLGRNMPAWANSPLARIGGHTFYAPDEPKKKRST